MKRIVALTGALALCVGLQATGAAADQITVTNIAMPYYETLTIDSPIAPTGGYVGQLVLTTSANQIIDAWCIDLYHDTGLGSTNLNYEIVPIATDNHPNYASGTPLTTMQIDEIAGLIAYGDNLLATDAPGSRNQDSAAVQLAIWAVEYPTFSYSSYPASGNPAPQALIDETNSVIALAPSLNGDAWELEGLAGQQSYATLVPEPGSMALFGAALFGLLLLRRRDPQALPL